MEKFARYHAFCLLPLRRGFSVLLLWHFDNLMYFGNQYLKENLDTAESLIQKTGIGGIFSTENFGSIEKIWIKADLH